MTNLPHNSSEDSDAPYEREPTRRIPRWLKVAGIVVAVLILLVVIVMLMTPGDGGGHGPRRHGLAYGWSCGSWMLRYM